MTQTEEKVDVNAAAETGVGPTVVVAIEQYFPEEVRLIRAANF